MRLVLYPIWNACDFYLTLVFILWSIYIQLICISDGSGICWLQKSDKIYQSMWTKRLLGLTKLFKWYAIWHVLPLDLFEFRAYNPFQKIMFSLFLNYTTMCRNRGNVFIPSFYKYARYSNRQLLNVLYKNEGNGLICWWFAACYVHLWEQFNLIYKRKKKVLEWRQM